MAETLQHESMTLESTTVKINRTAATVKGGRRMSFSALVVVGDRNGSVGIGYGKAPGVPAAIEKAQKDARKKIQRIELREGTLPHPIAGRFGASNVRLIPAAPGTGVIAGGTVRAVLEMAGVQDCLTKSYGSNNEINVVKAVMAGLLSIKTREQVQALRGIELEPTDVEEKINASKEFQKASEEEAARAAAEAAKRAPMRPKPAPKKKEAPAKDEAKEQVKDEAAGQTAAETTEQPAPQGEAPQAEEAAAAQAAPEAPSQQQSESPAENAEQAAADEGQAEQAGGNQTPDESESDASKPSE